jgi:hypothetical protein
MTFNESSTASRLFRKEAIDNQFSSADGSSLLDPSPFWTWATLLGSATIAIAAVAYLLLAEVAISTPLDGVVRGMPGAFYVVAPLGTDQAAQVHAGDRVRIRIAATEGQDRYAGFVDGVVSRAASGPAIDPACIPTGQTAAPWSGLEVALPPSTGGPTDNIRWQPGTRVMVLLPQEKRRLVDIVFRALQHGS